MDFGIEGKWALVCGANKGLGLGCAQALVGEGVNLVINARAPDALHQAASLLIAIGADRVSARGQNDAKPAVDAKEQRKQDAQARQQLAEKTRPLKRELEQIDQRLSALVAERADLEQRLTQPLPPAEIADLGRRLKAGHDETAQLEERWLEISAGLEELGVGTSA